MFVDLGATGRRVERLPWVATATVERQLPGDLSIRVTERTPAAWVRRTPDEVTVLDGDGRVLTDAPEAPADLPELTGTGPVPAPGGEVRPAGLAHVLGEVVPELRAEIERVTAGTGTVVLVRREEPMHGRTGAGGRRGSRWRCCGRSRPRTRPTSTCRCRTRPSRARPRVVDHGGRFRYGVDQYHRFT